MRCWHALREPASQHASPPARWQVFILNNTSMIQDEMLSHRLGLVPIYADPRKFRERAAEEDADEHNVISFRLQIKCEAGRGVRHRHTGLQG